MPVARFCLCARGTSENCSLCLVTSAGVRCRMCPLFAVADRNLSKHRLFSELPPSLLRYQAFMPVSSSLLMFLFSPLGLPRSKAACLDRTPVLQMGRDCVEVGCVQRVCNGRGWQHEGWQPKRRAALQPGSGSHSIPLLLRSGGCLIEEIHPACGQPAEYSPVLYQAPCTLDLSLVFWLPQAGWHFGFSFLVLLQGRCGLASPHALLSHLPSLMLLAFLPSISSLGASFYHSVLDGLWG